MNQSNAVVDNNPVVDNIIRFLQSDQNSNMECFYSRIRDRNRNRFFDETIMVYEDNMFDSFFPAVSIVILTANKIECDSLNYVANSQPDSNLIKRRNPVPVFENSYLCAPTAYMFKFGSYYVLHLCAYETGSNTPGGSTDIVRLVSNNKYLHPSCIISFGICYGRDPQKQHIGDVLIPSKLYPWSIGQKITDNKLTIKHDNFNLWLEDKFSPNKLYTFIRNFCNGTDGKIFSTRIPALSNSCYETEMETKVVLCNMSTGEAVVSSADAKEKIREANRNEEELGGEMEGYGIAKECIYYAKIPCIILKAICDWGDQKNIEEVLSQLGCSFPSHLKDRLQAYAAFSAAFILFKMLGMDNGDIFRPGIIDYLITKHICTHDHSCSINDLLKGIKKYLGDARKETNIAILDTLNSLEIIQRSYVHDRYTISKGNNSNE